MIAASLVTWIRANVTELATSAFVFDKLFIVSEHPLPVCVVTPMTHTTEPWIMGDASRRHNIKLQITVYHKSDSERRFLENKIIRLIETTTATDENSHTVPGINLLGVWDLLYNPSADLKTYVSYQPAWFAAPAPVYYKNGNLAVNIITAVGAGFTPDLTNGQIVFAAVQAAADKFYVTYKAGVIDFIIGDISNPSIYDLANKEFRYNTVLTLNTWFYIKATAKKLY